MTGFATKTGRGRRPGAVLAAGVLLLAAAASSGALASTTTYFGEVRCDRQDALLIALGKSHREYQEQGAFSSLALAQSWIAAKAMEREAMLELLGSEWNCVGVVRTSGPYADDDH